MNKKSWIQWVFFLAIGLLYFGLKLNFHELWKDEWQPWLLARDMGLFEMLGYLHLEGHPSLWFCYLKPWTWMSNILDLSPDGQVMLFGIAHGLLFLSSLYLLLFRFRLPLWLKISLACSFFFFYEYGIVNRGYILLIFLSFLLASLPDKLAKKNYWPAALLFLICQTEVYGVFIAGALYVSYCIQYIERNKKYAFWKDQGLLKQGMALLLGVAVFVATVFPRSEFDVIGINTTSSMLENISSSFQGNFSNTFWIGLIPDTNVFGPSVFGLLASLAIVVLLFAVFFKEKNLLFSFLAYMLAVFSFSAIVYQGGVRHWGINFIFFIVLLELYTRKGHKFVYWQIAIIASFLLCQFYYNFRAISRDYNYPFSNARQAALFINDKVPADVPIVAINKFESAPVAAYSGRPFYALPEGAPFTYYQWLDKIYLPSEAELKIFAEYKNKSGLVVISPKPLGPQRYPNVELWKEFDNFNMKNEFYFLYLLSGDK